MKANINLTSIFCFVIKLIGLQKTFSESGIEGLSFGSDTADIYPISVFQTNNKSCACGESVKARIVGGEVATAGEFPWQVAFYYSSHRFCGGTLITNLHVVTAAHCIRKKLNDLNKITIYLGVTDFDKMEAGYQTRNVVKAKINPQHNWKYNYHDICIITLNYPVQFTQKISPPCFGQTGRNDIDVMATVIGWGKLQFGGSSTQVLNKVEVPIRDPLICRRLKPNYSIQSHQICAFWNEGGKDSCLGDSGSSMLVQNPVTSRWFFVGIVSFGWKCAQQMTPAFYTRLTSYYDWITQETIDGVGCSG